MARISQRKRNCLLSAIHYLVSEHNALPLLGDDKLEENTMKQVKVKVQGKRGWQGKVRIIVYSLDGSIKDVTEIDLVNKINDLDLNMMRNALKGDITDLKLHYMGWGGDATAPGAGDTKLIDEFGRKLVTLQEVGATGVLVTTTYIAPYEGNEKKIEELGWFAGSAATIVKDSGILVGRVLYPRQKTELESWQVERTDTFSEVGG